MTITFLNGKEINVLSVAEDKKIHVVPKKWELIITSNTDLSSEELDALLVEENMLKLLHQKDDGTVKEILNYNEVTKVNKVHYSDGVTMTIVLRKEITEDAC